jgi:hypothetical protein
LNAGWRQPIVAPADLTRFFVAFGLVPLLLASQFVGRIGPPAAVGEPSIVGGLPWSFALTATWSLEQLVFIVLAGAVLGVTSGRPAQGLAAVGLGSLLGMAADLWWFAGWVRPEDQTFVTMLPQAEWRSRLTGSALGLIGGVSTGFVIAAVVRWLIRHRPRLSLRAATRSEFAAAGVAVIGGPLLALWIASAAASSALVVPDGAPVQMVWVSGGAIAVDPAVLRAGPTRFRCQYALDATPVWAYLIPLPNGVELDAVSPSFPDYRSACGQEPGKVTWGGVADLQPGRYVWVQIDNSTDVQRTIATSPAVVVTP